MTKNHPTRVRTGGSWVRTPLRTFFFENFFLTQNAQTDVGSRPGHHPELTDASTTHLGHQNEFSLFAGLGDPALHASHCCYKRSPTVNIVKAKKHPHRDSNLTKKFLFVTKGHFLKKNFLTRKRSDRCEFAFGTRFRAHRRIGDSSPTPN